MGMIIHGDNDDLSNEELLDLLPDDYHLTDDGFCIGDDHLSRDEIIEYLRGRD